VSRLSRSLGSVVTAAVGFLTAQAGAATAAKYDVTIARDNWGIAHVSGRTDADAVFGMMYAQAEDDFNRIETNYLTSLGRLAEAEPQGPDDTALWQDLRQRLFIDPDALKTSYARCPSWLQSLMQAWADGLNAYLESHPNTHPRVLTRFEPWMALSFPDGGANVDIEQVSLESVRDTYDSTSNTQSRSPPAAPSEPSGSNGIAIAPKLTRDGHALLLINPHTRFFFRSEQQVTSAAGLNVYGAATWGQFFVYQGFNEHVGWMHTASGVDNVDEFLETARIGPNDTLQYRYGTEARDVQTKNITLAYKAADGTRHERTFVTYATHHGPVVGEWNNRLITVALMNKPIEALQQSFLTTKATDYASFLQAADLRANSSANTIFADSKGEIAYLHPQFVARRDGRYDYSRPVDGSDPTTDWQGAHTLDSLPHVLNPSNGWVMNTNNWPWTAAGSDSPHKDNFPRYMDQAGENPRGLHVEGLLNGKSNFTPQSLMATAYDPYLIAFAPLIPELIAAHGRLGGDVAPEHNIQSSLADPIDLLKHWDLRWSLDSTATTLAVYWGEALSSMAPLPQTSDTQKLTALQQAVDQLTNDFGSWRVPWGEVNRYQRNSGDITQTFDDRKPSTPIPFASAQWGSLASFGATRYPNTKRRYGTTGSSFVAIVEFGRKVHAWAVSTGGESSDPQSPHFNDQASRYAQGDLRQVYFYPDDLKNHIEHRYRPSDPARH
jgi:acyl-homoserine-lactone acylase